MTRQSNRDRWPELAEAVDQLKAAFGQVHVLSIYENGKLVAGKHYERNLIVPEEDWLPKRKKQ
jgi:hypothetical protein